MKKLLYLFLVLPLVFSSCKKEEDKVQGCTDSAATNYSSNANEDNGSCLYSITGCWEWQTGTVNGTDVFSASGGMTDVVLYFWDDGSYGVEYYVPGGLAMYDLGTYSLSANQTSMSTVSDTYQNTGNGFALVGSSETALNISKFNSNEFDGGWDDNDGVGIFTSTKSSTYFLGNWKK